MDIMEVIHRVKSMVAIKDDTPARPTTGLHVGLMYLDTTLSPEGKPIWWNGAKWVDATGKEV